MSYIKLKLCNWGIAPADVIQLCMEFEEKGLVDFGQVLYFQLLYKGMGANPHDLEFGNSLIFSETLIHLLLRGASDPNRPTVEEIEQILKYVPEIAEAYELEIEGEDWVLTLKAPRQRRRLCSEDWTRHEWIFFFDAGVGELRFLPIQGTEFHAALRLFSWLNGERTEEEIRHAFRAEQALVDRFLGFACELGLIERSGSPLRKREAGVRGKQPKRVGRSSTFDRSVSGVELLGHSSLIITAGDDRILVDPAFIIPPLHNRNASYFARMDEVASEFDRLSGIIVTHHHWDHLNLQTLARIPRHTPIYIPGVGAQNKTLPFNPSIEDFLVSLGFERVKPLRWREPCRIGQLKIMALPFFGEWFGPGSAFDGNTVLIEINGKCVLCTIDADRNERGNMQRVLRELAETGRGPVDYLFCCCTGQRHRSPTFCGAPFKFSNTFAVKHARRMRYHPDRKTIARWCEIIRPRYIVPYAQFIFHNDARRAAPIVLDDLFPVDDFFETYWSECLKSDEAWLMRWKGELRALMDDVGELGTRLIMLGPGEMIQV